ncbi:MAG TPA: glycosyltransferase N-terminal domain-containing protein [Gemmatimonadaceae bacterium]|nr:glycosyltransferase N-terminal domain-containing protein [Gemmatimonadaceae bacterium]
MRSLLRALYAVAAKLASAASLVLPPGNSKAVIAVRARRGIRKRYATWARAHRDESRPLLWMHAPSVGEGLQARPVLTLVRARRPDVQLAYTFFSPSAEEFSRTLDVDFRDYLPFDTTSDMGAALDALRPRAVVFSKLDVWPELVRQAKKRGIRVGLISATLGAVSGRRSRAGNLLLQDAYAMLDSVGTVDAEDGDRLVELGVHRDVVELTGDTRFDQVWQRAESVDRESVLQKRLASDRPTIVAGSTWPSDEAPLLDAFRGARRQVPDLRIVIAPHELTPAHLEAVERWASTSQLALARVDGATAQADVVLVDRFGVLGELYALADIAFVGGGFHDAGLHSVLEPAAFGTPVLFGPKHHKSRDALILLAAGAAVGVNSASDLEQVLARWLRDPVARREAGAEARAAVDRGRGAAERSLRIVERLLGD